LRGVDQSFVTGVLGQLIGPHLQESSGKRRISLLDCLVLIMVPILFSDNVDKLLTRAHKFPENQRPQTLQHKPEILQAARIIIFHFLW